MHNPNAGKKDAPAGILKKPTDAASSRPGANRKECFSNDNDLNFVQKNYEHKFAPRHYKPNLAEKRMVRINEIEPKDARKKRQKKEK